MIIIYRTLLISSLLYTPLYFLMECQDTRGQLIEMKIFRIDLLFDTHAAAKKAAVRRVKDIHRLDVFKRQFDIDP